MARLRDVSGNIVLIGFMGSGKSEVGRHLAERTGRKLVDVDSVVEAEGLTIPEIFAAEGEAGFRRRERRAIERVARSTDAVIATGGGAVLDPVNVKALKRRGVLVYLKASPDVLTRRLGETSDRPLLRSSEGPTPPASVRKRVRSLLAERLPVYETVADHIVATDELRPDEVTDAIMRRLASQNGSSMTRIRVALEPPYSVLVGRQILERVSELVIVRGAENICVISHPRIRRLWGKTLEKGLRATGARIAWATFPSGEERKTIDTAARLARTLAREGFHRGDVVYALGGGVVGDVAGFVASTYARGIAVVQVPTTLLAMVDAAIGGKTGVNLPQGKNLVGTFHQPAAVLADLDVLATLPERELRGGLAEVVKYGFIADPPLSELVVRRRAEIFDRETALDGIVVRCARIKARVVAADERELGERAILNYGHTLGHALEALSVAGRLKARLHHGEAVAIGMVYAAAVSAESGRADADLVDEHRRVLEAVGLPTTVSGVTWSEIRDRMIVDKKYARGMRLVLLDEPGKPVVRPVGAKILARAFDAVGA